MGELCQPSEVTYQYDVRGQLLEERRMENSKDVTTLYRYDAAGNRVSRACTDGDTAYAYNEKNQLICKEGTRGKTTFTYSRQGSILLEEGPDGIREFAYNSKNQQVQVKCGNVQTQENRYDSEGLRHEMRENEKLLRCVYHRGQLLYEGGIEEKSYHLGIGADAVRSGVTDSYYHRDEQLSTALTTGEDGGVQNYYQYDAFGVLLENGEKCRNRIRYTGQQYDMVTGQYYLRARYYRPDLGRFMQEDVYRGDGLNLYAYCQNNPVNYYDPTGYSSDPSCVSAKFAQGNGENQVPTWDGSGPVSGVIGVNENSQSVSALLNYNPKDRENGLGHAIEFVYDANTKTFVVGKPQVSTGGSPHQQLAGTIGANTSSLQFGGDPNIVGGMFLNGGNGTIFTNENSGHFGSNWTPGLRQDFVNTMSHYGVQVNHEGWKGNK